MTLKTNILAILAIFCVILSACAVSAADGSADYNIDDGQSVHDDMILPPDYAHNEAAQAAGGDDASADNDWTYSGDPEPGNGMPIENQTYNHDGDAAGNATNATGHAAGENATAAAANATNATAAHSMPATGNPILILLGVGAVLGGAFVLKRKH